MEGTNIKRNVLYATGFFEIGDVFYDEEGKPRTITDIMLVHYIRRGTYKVLYEVDHQQPFVELLIKDYDDQFAKATESPSRANLSIVRSDQNNTDEGGEGTAEPEA